MGTLRATQFCDVVITGPGPVALFTVPAGHRYILRSINMYNPEGTVNGLTVTIGTSPTIASQSMPVAGGIGNPYNLQPWIVLNPGQTINGWANSGKHGHFILSGSDLFI